MKKLIFAIFILFVTSNIYVSCTPEAISENDELQTSKIEKEEIKDDDI